MPEKVWLTFGSARKPILNVDLQRHMVPGLFENKSYVDMDSTDNDLNGTLLAVLAELDSDILYSGEKFLVMCFAPKLFYSRGQHLQVNWKNGTFSMIKLRKWTSMNKIIYFRKNAGINFRIGSGFEVAFGEDIVANNEMELVSCWTPLNNSSDWSRVSQKMNVLPNGGPKFSEELSETVTFYLGDELRILECTVEESIPASIVIVLFECEAKSCKT